jgi:tetratricopeptide (TPR) repeat protein
VLVVLDNAANEAQIRPLLPGAGSSLMIITSRRLLAGIDAVQRLPLTPMADSEAEALLTTIVATPGHTPDPSDLARVSALCGNLPLALRIAGNRLMTRPSWNAGDLADRLADEELRLEHLAVGDLQVAMAFRLSYEQLTAPARTAFRRLSLVPGPDFDAVLASTLTGRSVVETEFVLDELVEVGLVNPMPGARFAFHDLIRLFSRQQLALEEPANERAEHERRMIESLLELTQVAGRWFEPKFGAPPPEWSSPVDLSSAELAQRWLEVESANWLGAFHLAAAAGRHELVIDAAESLHWFSDRWMRWGHWHEVFGLSRDAARQLGDPALEAVHLNYLCWAEQVCLGQLEQSLESAHAAAELARSVGDDGQVAWALSNATFAYRRLGELEKAGEMAAEAARLFSNVGDREGQSQALLEVAFVLADQNRHVEALASYDEVEALLTDPSTAPSRDVVLWTYAAMEREWLHVALGDWSRADEASKQALDAACELGIDTIEARVRVRRGRLLAGRQEAAAAADEFRRAHEMFVAGGETALAAGIESELEVRD